MLKIQSAQDLQNIIDGVKETLLFTIRETLKVRNQDVIDFNTTITNNWIDDGDNEQIEGYSLHEDTVQVEMNFNNYNLKLASLKVEVLMEILSAIEREEYTDALADDDEN